MGHVEGRPVGTVHLRANGVASARRTGGDRHVSRHALWRIGRQGERPDAGLRQLDVGRVVDLKGDQGGHGLGRLYAGGEGLVAARGDGSWSSAAGGAGDRHPWRAR